MELLAAVLALGATICWGMDQVIGKLALRDIDALTFNALRPPFAMVFIIPYALLLEQLSFGSLEIIALVAFAGFIAEFLGAELYFYILKRSAAHRVIPVGNSDTLWATLIAISFFGEEARAVVFLAIALVIVGTFFLSQENVGDSDSKWRAGVFLAIFVAFLWGLALPVTKYCFENGMTPAAAQTIRIAVASLLCNALFFARRPRYKSGSSISKALKLTLLSGFLAFFLGFLLWLQALKMISASTIAPFLGGKVAFGFIFSILILRERATKKAILGMFSVLAGIILVTI